MLDSFSNISKALPEGQFSVMPPRAGIPLHSMLTSCGYQDLTARAPYDWHGRQRGTADFAVFQYTLSGKGRLTYESRHMELGPGDAMLVCIPHDHRYYLPPDSDGWSFVYVCMSGREIMRLCRKLISDIGPAFPLQPDSLPVKIACQAVEQAAKQAITSAYTASSTAYDLTMAICNIKDTTGRQDNLPEPIRRACDYCRTNAASPIDVEQMARAAHWSRAHFTRQFQQAMRMTPITFLTSVRLQEAVRLLQQTDLPLKDIAPRCGFPDGNYLCRVFRKTYGVTPGAFRRTGMY